MHGPGEVGVRAGQDGVQGLDQHDLAAEGGIDGAQFHADVAAADDEQVLGHVLHFERLAGGHDARVAQVERLGHGRLRADGDDGLVVVDELLALLGLHAQGLRILEVAASVHDLDAAQSWPIGRCRRKAGPGWTPSKPQLGDIDGRRRERDAAMLGFAGGGDGMGGVEQGFGGNAAAVEADAAQACVPLDEDDFLAEVGRVKCRRVTAGAGAEDHDFSLD